ncbi:hypothetical protein L3X38_000145 [Prunus dulcis]|uniref:Uncharacterized protein n=1 Tax=Prunus dulcis TaxID=3755 RepID=A0AAD4URY6_PRUDU|nr:hypothetical protein L3X38_000145 [Prunus dulcis]
MASRAMLRRKRIVKDGVVSGATPAALMEFFDDRRCRCTSLYLHKSSSGLGHYHGSQKSESWGFSSIIVHMHRGNNDDNNDKVSVPKDEFRLLGGWYAVGY